MAKALTNILLKIFVNGFYRAHAGLFLFIGLIMVGAIPPNQLWMYEKTLMLAFTTGPIMMLVVFAAWLVYTIKSLHYVYGQIYAVNQQFLFYSSNAFSKREQFKSWFITQFAILLPIAGYGLIAVFVGIINHYYLDALIILAYITFLTAGSAALYVKLVNRLIDGSSQSLLLKMGRKWRKPFFSLFIYHVFDKMKVTYLVTKALSWLLITGLFYLFADVSHDVRVAGITVLAIITGHSFLIYNEHAFENQYLSFSRNLPIGYAGRFFNFIKVYFILLLPEAIWLFSRFNPFPAAELLLAGLSIALLFHCLLYVFGLNMDRYIQWVMGLFIITFWIILYGLLWMLIPLNLCIAYFIFYRKVYLVH